MAQRMHSPGMETIKSVAELRYSLDTTLVDPEQHAMAQAAAAAAAAVAAASSVRPGTTELRMPAPVVRPLPMQQQQQAPLHVPVVAPAGSSEHAAVPGAEPVAAVVPADGAAEELPGTASVLALQQQLLLAGQERRKAEQTADQLQQQVQDLLLQQQATSTSFQEQLQQAREAAAAELQAAQQVCVRLLDQHS
jgi:hypothetical protein